MSRWLLCLTSYFVAPIIANNSGHVANMLYSGYFNKFGNLTIFKTAARERNNIIIIMITLISFYCLQNIRHYNFKLSSFCGNLYYNKSPEIDALLGVAVGIVVDDCWLTTNNNLQITTKVLIPNKSHLRMNLWPKISFRPVI